MLYKSVDEILKCNRWDESYRAVLSFGTFYCAVEGGFECAGEIQRCGHSNESYWTILSSGAVMLYKVVVTFQLDEILKCDRAIESYWAVPFCGAFCCFTKRKNGRNFVFVFVTGGYVFWQLRLEWSHNLWIIWWPT